MSNLKGKSSTSTAIVAPKGKQKPSTELSTIMQLMVPCPEMPFTKDCSTERSWLENNETYTALPDKAKSNCALICKLAKHDAQTTLIDRFAMGTLFNEVVNTTKEDGGVYGKHAVATIGELAGLETGPVRDFMKLAKVFTLDDVKKINKSAELNGVGPLTYTNIRNLSRVESEMKRTVLFNKAIDRKCTTAELAHDIAILLKKKPGDRRGRPAKVPSDFFGTVRQQQKLAENWAKLYSRVWTRSNESLQSKASSLSEKDLSDDKVKELKDLGLTLKEVSENAAKAATEADIISKHLEKRLKDLASESQGSQSAAKATKPKKTNKKSSDNAPMKVEVKRAS